MCTAITLQTTQGENFFGRTMDFSHPIEPGLYVIPKNYEWRSLINNEIFTDYYSFICIGQQTENILGFFDGVNEKGFAAAALYFAGYANYNFSPDGKVPIASLDFLHYILGQCSSINDLKKILSNIYIAGVVDPVTQTAAPLHWIATDKSGKSAVIEQTDKGLMIIDNPIGVMGNSPDFQWQMTNLRNYMNVSPVQSEEAEWNSVKLKPFGQGGGTSCLPGGYTSPERFVRTAFVKTHVPTPTNRLEAITACFHAMNSVSIPKGIVLTSKGTYDYTMYTAFMNTNTCEYFIKTYENSQISTACLWNYYLYSAKPIYLGSIVRPVTFDYYRLPPRR